MTLHSLVVLSNYYEEYIILLKKYRFFLGIGPLRVLRKTMDTVVPRIDYRQQLIKVDDI